MSKFFRIIIPNNNSEPWIRHGLDTIVSQTFKDWELVIVDDASVDNSPAIIKEYAEKYPITFVRLPKKKGFPGDVREEALKYATDSEYTLFLDSDDWFADNEVFEKVWEKAEETHADVIRMPFLIYESASKITPVVMTDKNIKEFVESPFVAPWTKAVKTSKMQPFETQSIYDDILNHLLLADTIDTISYIEAPFCAVWNRQQANQGSVTVDINGDEWKRRKYCASLFRMCATCTITKFNRECVQERADSWASFAKNMIKQENLI